MNTRRKWDLSEISHSTETINAVENSPINPIKLVLNPNQHQSFYQYHFHEKTWINGNLHRKEIKKLIHLSASQNKSGIISLHIESFDRIHLDRNLSISDKEFISQIHSITEDIIFTTDQYAHSFTIKNLEEIQRKANLVLAKIEKNYKGKFVEKELIFLKNFYQDPEKIIHDLLKYKQYGLLIPQFYRYFDSKKTFQTYTKHRFMENVVTDVVESIQPILENESFLEFEQIGNLKIEDKNKTYAFILGNRKVVLKGNEIGKLDKYNGRFVIHKKSGLVHQSSLELEFSFGENYRKNIYYQLNPISYKQIK